MKRKPKVFYHPIEGCLAPNDPATIETAFV